MLCAIEHSKGVLRFAWCWMCLIDILNRSSDNIRTCRARSEIWFYRWCRGSLGFWVPGLPVLHRRCRILGAEVVGLAPRIARVFSGAGIAGLAPRVSRVLGARVASLTPRVARVFWCWGYRTCTEGCLGLKHKKWTE